MTQLFAIVFTFAVASAPADDYDVFAHCRKDRGGIDVRIATASGTPTTAYNQRGKDPRDLGSWPAGEFERQVDRVTAALCPGDRFAADDFGVSAAHVTDRRDRRWIEVRTAADLQDARALYRWRRGAVDRRTDLSSLLSLADAAPKETSARTSVLLVLTHCTARSGKDRVRFDDPPAKAHRDDLIAVYEYKDSYCKKGAVGFVRVGSFWWVSPSSLQFKPASFENLKATDFIHTFDVARGHVTPPMRAPKPDVPKVPSTVEPAPQPLPAPKPAPIPGTPPPEKPADVTTSAASEPATTGAWFWVVLGGIALAGTVVLIRRRRAKVVGTPAEAAPIRTCVQLAVEGARHDGAETLEAVTLAPGEYAIVEREHWDGAGFSIPEATVRLELAIKDDDGLPMLGVRNTEGAPLRVLRNDGNGRPVETRSSTTLGLGDAVEVGPDVRLVVRSVDTLTA